MKTQGMEQKAPKDCRSCSRYKLIKPTLRLSRLLAKMTKGIEERLRENDIKATVSDYIRLLQLEKEIDDEAPKEIKVTWVEPTVKSDSGE